jgi:RNA ligase (TIGR02306 family)
MPLPLASLKLFKQCNLEIKMSEVERNLVSIRVIEKLEPITGADLIECAYVDGWSVVVKKGEYTVGDSAVFFEPDTFLPDGDGRWQFLVDKSSRMFNGVRGHVLRTIRLKGVYSNGLLLPVCVVGNLADLKLFKFEPYTGDEACKLSSNAKGNFPGFIPKTSAERIQNLGKTVFSPERIEDEYEVTMKMDGSSFTVYIKDGEVGCCSRNLDLKLDDSGAFVDMFNRLGLKEALPKLGKNIAFQGELFGAGINGNNEKMNHHMYSIFNVWLIDERRYASPVERYGWFAELRQLVTNPELFIHVPVLWYKNTLHEMGLCNVSDILKFAEGPSYNKDMKREGLVFKSVRDPSFSFKAISESWLAKKK